MSRGIVSIIAALAAAPGADAAQTARYASQTAAVLAVEAPFAPAGGAVRVTVYDSAETFLVKPAAKLEGVVNEEGVAVVDLAALHAGVYAFAAYFDADGDGRLKRGRLGRPKEPFVFSNNIRPRLSRPSFAETSVRAAPGDVIVMTLKN